MKKLVHCASRRPLLIPRQMVRPKPINYADLTSLPPTEAAGPTVFKMGTALFDLSVPFGFSTEYTKVHLAVLGESGAGKSKLIQLLTQFRLMAGHGGMLVDPADDLADAVLAFIAYRLKIGDPAMMQRCHVLTIEEKLALPLRRLRRASHPYIRLPANIRGTARCPRGAGASPILRRLPGTEIEVMNRLIPRFKAVIMAGGVDHDGRGAHIGLDKGSILCSPSSPEFPHLMDLVFPHLPDDQQDVFREIMAERLVQGIKDRWESTQNRFRRALSPAIKLAVSSGPSIDFKKAVANREFIIVRGKQSERVPPDVAMTMNGLLIDGFLQVKEAEENLPEHLRVPSSLTIDEVGDYLSEGLVWALCNDRKVLLEITVGAQNYMRMCNDNVALGDYVLTQCGTVVCFTQRGQSADYVADRMFRGNESYTQRLREVQRQRGWFVVQTPDFGISGNQTLGTGEAKNWARTESDTKNAGVQKGRIFNWAHMDSTGDVSGKSKARADSDVHGSNASLTLQPIIVGGIVVANTPTATAGSNSSSSSQTSFTDTESQSTGAADTHGGAVTEVHSRIEGHAIARMQGGSNSKTEANGKAWSLSLKTALSPNYILNYEWDGGYEEGPPEVQHAAFLRWLHCLNVAECFVSVRGCPYAFPVKIDHVQELWSTPEKKWHAVQIIIKKIAAQHPYMFSPADLTDAVLAHRRMNETTAGRDVFGN